MRVSVEKLLFAYHRKIIVQLRTLSNDRKRRNIANTRYIKHGTTEPWKLRNPQYSCVISPREDKGIHLLQKKSLRRAQFTPLHMHTSRVHIGHALHVLLKSNITESTFCKIKRSLDIIIYKFTLSNTAKILQIFLTITAKYSTTSSLVFERANEFVQKLTFA